MVWLPDRDKDFTRLGTRSPGWIIYFQLAVLVLVASALNYYLNKG